MEADSGDILVLGSSGRIGGLVADRLRALGQAVRVVSRSPDRPDVLRFDWDDPATFAPALAGVRAVFVVGPTDHIRPVERMSGFIAQLTNPQIDRVVLLTASSIPSGAPGLGEVDETIRGLGVPWNTVRPTWFSQNFLDPAHAVGSAVLHGRSVITATGAGRVPFVDAVDIAEVAAAALLGEVDPDGELIVTGPAALTYDEAVGIVAGVTGFPIGHRSVSPERRTESYERSGLDTGLAELLTRMDIAIAGGAEDRVSDVVPQVLGRPATTLEAVIRRDLPLVAPELAAPPADGEVPLVDLYRRHVFAAIAGDADSLRDVWEPDGVLEFPYAIDTPARLDGIDAIVEYFEAGVSVFSDWSFGQAKTWRIEGAAEFVVEVSASATLAPEGRPYRQRYIVRFGVSPGGRIAWMREFWNPAEMAG